MRAACGSIYMFLISNEFLNVVLCFQAQSNAFFHFFFSPFFFSYLNSLDPNPPQTAGLFLVSSFKHTNKKFIGSSRPLDPRKHKNLCPKPIATIIEMFDGVYSYFFGNDASQSNAGNASANEGNNEWIFVDRKFFLIIN